MERRLCYQHGLNHPNAGPSGSLPTAPKLTAQEAREKAQAMTIPEYQKLAGIVPESAIDRLMQPYVDDPKKLEEMAYMRLTTFTQRTEETARMFAEQMEGMEERLHTSLGPAESKRVIPIVQALKKPITVNNVNKHLYAHADGGINFKQIEDDRAMIRTFTQAFPLAQADLLQIDHALDILRKQDDRYEIRDSQNVRKNNAFDSVVNDIGKKTGFILLFAVVVLTGVPAIVEAIKTGKIDFKHAAPPLLALAVMGFIASPHLRRQIFASADQNTMKDINATLNNTALQKLLADYNVQGNNWARIANTIMEKPADTRSYLAKLKKNGSRIEGLEKETNSYIQSMTTGPQERETLRQMIADGRFADFVHILSFTTTKDARIVISDYIRLGSQQSLAAMRNNAQKINHGTL